MLQNKPNPKSQSAISIVVSLLVLAAVVTATTWRPAIINQLNSWKLLPEPEKLTELYFTQPNKLPSVYSPGQSQTVNFTVHNIEYQTMTYRYAIVEESQDGTNKQTLTSNSFTIDQNQYKHITYTGPLADVGPNAKVVIELPTVNESIDCLLVRSAS